MVDKNVNFTLVFEIEECQIYTIQNETNEVYKTGILGIYQLPDQKMLLLRMDDWQYLITKDIQILTQENLNQILYVLPKKSDYWGVFIPESASQEHIEFFQKLIQDNGNLMSGQLQVVEYEMCDQYEQGQQPVQPVKVIPEQSVSEQVENFLIKGGSFIQQNLLKGGKWVGSNIEKGGEFVQCKIGQPKPVDISNSTMVKVKLAKTVSSTVVTYSVGQVETLIKSAKIIGKIAMYGGKSSKAVSTIKKLKYYGDVANVANGSSQGLASVYLGMFGALSQIGSSLQCSTRNIISHKYGERAGEISMLGTDIVGDVGNKLNKIVEKNVGQIPKQKQIQQQQQQEQHIPNDYI